MEKKEMLDALIAYYCKGNKAQFAIKIGIKPQALSMWFSRNSLDAELIYTHCENLSGDWLLSGGVGNMLRSESISADYSSIAAGGGSRIQGNITTTTNNHYGEGCGGDAPSPIVQMLTESVATLTRELETSQEQKNSLIKIIDKLTEK